jgi:DNA-binding IclR family transcriptional regulator
MTKTRSAQHEAKSTDAGKSARGRLGSQTLFRGLNVVEVVADGSIALAELAARLGLTRSTTHRLASALVDRRYLAFVPGSGYSLGPKLLELGYKVRDELDLRRVALAHLERLALITDDTVHLGVLDHNRVLYLDKIPGQRRISISSRIGELQPVCSTGLGKALVLDHGEESWANFFRAEKGIRRMSSQDEWMARMRNYAHAGCALDLEENEDQIRCVAAPIRDVGGRIVAAISVSSAAQYMNDERVQMLSHDVVDTARRISHELGWTLGESDNGARGPDHKSAAVHNAPTRIRPERAAPAKRRARATS